MNGEALALGVVSVLAFAGFVRPAGSRAAETVASARARSSDMLDVAEKWRHERPDLVIYFVLRSYSANDHVRANGGDASDLARRGVTLYKEAKADQAKAEQATHR